MADAETAVVLRRAPRRLPGAACSASSRGRCRGAGSRPPTGPTPTPPGTLFPRSSKKAARAINAASGNRPLVVLANLSGFDGSPDSMRNLQLEYGAEIGRAIVNFDGPIVFVRDLALPRRRVRGVLQGAEPEHDRAGARGLLRLGDRRRAGGGGRLRRRGGKRRVRGDARIAELEDADRRGVRDRAGPAAWSSWPSCAPPCAPEKIGEVAAEFDGVHNIHRAVAGRVGRRGHHRRPSCGRGWCRRSRRVSPSSAEPSLHSRAGWPACGQSGRAWLGRAPSGQWPATASPAAWALAAGSGQKAAASGQRADRQPLHDRRVTRSTGTGRVEEGPTDVQIGSGAGQIALFRGELHVRRTPSARCTEAAVRDSSQARAGWGTPASGVRSPRWRRRTRCLAPAPSTPRANASALSRELERLVAPRRAPLQAPSARPFAGGWAGAVDEGSPGPGAGRRRRRASRWSQRWSWRWPGRW